MKRRTASARAARVADRAGTDEVWPGLEPGALLGRPGLSLGVEENQILRSRVCCAHPVHALRLRKACLDFRIVRSDCAKGALRRHSFARCVQRPRRSLCVCSSSRIKRRRTRTNPSCSTPVLEPTLAFPVRMAIAMASTISVMQRSQFSSAPCHRRAESSNAAGYVPIAASRASPAGCR